MFSPVQSTENVLMLSYGYIRVVKITDKRPISPSILKLYHPAILNASGSIFRTEAWHGNNMV